MFITVFCLFPQKRQPGWSTIWLSFIINEYFSPSIWRRCVSLGWLTFWSWGYPSTIICSWSLVSCVFHKNIKIVIHLSWQMWTCFGKRKVEMCNYGGKLSRQDHWTLFFIEKPEQGTRDHDILGMFYYESRCGREVTGLFGCYYVGRETATVEGESTFPEPRRWELLFSRALVNPGSPASLVTEKMQYEFSFLSPTPQRQCCCYVSVQLHFSEERQ